MNGRHLYFNTQAMSDIEKQLTDFFGKPGIHVVRPTRPASPAYRQGFESASVIAPDGYRVRFTDDVARNEFNRGRQDGLLDMMHKGTAEYKMCIARVTQEGRAAAAGTGKPAKNPYTRFSLANAWTRGHEQGLREAALRKSVMRTSDALAPWISPRKHGLSTTGLFPNFFIVDDPLPANAPKVVPTKDIRFTFDTASGYGLVRRTLVETPKPKPKPKPLIRDIQKHRLDMLTPSVQPGLNITVRSGAKWLKARPGDRLEIFKTGAYAHEQQFRGTVVSAVLLEPGERVPESLLRFNHAPGARTREGLNAAMASAYGADWESKPVVILSFWA